MRISIVIPVYNVSNYIERCLYSIINQKNIKADIECIIVDDCGEDDSIEKVKKIIDKENSDIVFKIIRHDRNRGLSAARNTGINVSTGDYLYFLDSDDYLVDDSLCKLISCVYKYKDVDMIQANFNILENKHVFHSAFFKTFKHSYYTTNKTEIMYNILDIVNFPMMAWNKLIKRQFVIENNLFFKEGIYYEDGLWSYFLAKKISSLYILNEYTYVYFIRDNSIMKTGFSSLKKIDSAIYILKEFISNIDTCNPYRKLQKIFILKKIMEEYILKDNEIYRSKIKSCIIDKFYSKCSIIGKIGLVIIKYLPISFLQKRIIYNLVLGKLIVKFV